MKAGLTVVEKLAQLRTIPAHMLPSTLKHKILLPKCTEIKLEANKLAKELGPTLAFYRKYVADLRLHNPHLKIHRLVTESGPLIARITLSKGEAVEPLVLEGNKFKSAEEIKNKIL